MTEIERYLVELLNSCLKFPSLIYLFNIYILCLFTIIIALRYIIY